MIVAAQSEPTVTIRIDEHNIFDVPVKQARRIYTELTRALENINTQQYVERQREAW